MNDPRPAMISARPPESRSRVANCLEHPHRVVGAEHADGARQPDALRALADRGRARRRAPTPRSRRGGARRRRTRRARPARPARPPRSARAAAARPRSCVRWRGRARARRTCRRRSPSVGDRSTRRARGGAEKYLHPAVDALPRPGDNRSMRTHHVSVFGVATMVAILIATGLRHAPGRGRARLGRPPDERRRRRSAHARQPGRSRSPPRHVRARAPAAAGAARPGAAREARRVVVPRPARHLPGHGGRARAVRHRRAGARDRRRDHVRDNHVAACADDALAGGDLRVGGHLGRDADRRGLRAAGPDGDAGRPLSRSRPPRA